MIGWETDPAVAAQSPKSAEFAEVWKAGEKIVFSRTLESVSTQGTRLERSFDAGLVRQIKAEAIRGCARTRVRGYRTPADRQQLRKSPPCCANLRAFPATIRAAASVCSHQ